LAFLRCTIGLILRPRTTVRQMQYHPRRLAMGFGGLLALSLVYIVVFTVCLAKNLVPLIPPVLRISPEEYFAYERFFIFPVAVGGTILMAGVIRLGCSMLSGRGRFLDLFAVIGFSHVIIAIAMGLPDLTLAILGKSAIGPHVYIGTIWFLILLLLIVRELECLSWPRTCVVSLLGALANAAVQFVFTR
jgi:hypothetical protein